MILDTLEGSEHANIDPYESLDSIFLLARLFLAELSFSFFGLVKNSSEMEP